LPDRFFDEYRADNIVPRLEWILKDINDFFTHQQSHPANIPPLSAARLNRLKAKRLITKLKQKLLKR
jgi:hypothetical protein